MFKKLLLCTFLTTSFCQAGILEDLDELCQDYSQLSLKAGNTVVEERNYYEGFKENYLHNFAHAIFNEILMFDIKLKNPHVHEFEFIYINNVNSKDQHKMDFSIIEKDQSEEEYQIFLTSDQFKGIEKDYEEESYNFIESSFHFNKLNFNTENIDHCFNIRQKDFLGTRFNNHLERLEKSDTLDQYSFKGSLEKFQNLLAFFYQNNHLSEEVLGLICKRLKIENFYLDLPKLLPPTSSTIFFRLDARLSENYSMEDFKKTLNTCLEDVPSSLERQALIATVAQNYYHDGGISNLGLDLCQDIQDHGIIISHNLTSPFLISKLYQPDALKTFQSNLKSFLEPLSDPRARQNLIASLITDLHQLHYTTLTIKETEHSDLILDLCKQVSQKDLPSYAKVKKIEADTLITAKYENEDFRKKAMKAAFDIVINLPQDTETKQILDLVMRTQFGNDKASAYNQVPQSLSKLVHSILAPEPKIEETLKATSEVVFLASDQQKQIQDLQAQIARLQAQLKEASL